MEKYINDACKHFETLIREQLKRAEAMKNAAKPVDYTKEDKIIIGVADGDGIGPIIMKEALKIAYKLLDDEIKAGKIEIRIIKGLTIENRIAKNQPVPEDVLAALKECHVILKGPTTTPKGGTMESANVTLRRELDLYANVRPVSIPELGIDWTFYRENTEGEYVLGGKGIEIPGELTMDFKVNTNLGTRRIAKAAFDFAKKNGKDNVAIITKANIMKKTDGAFSAICNKVAKEYPGITAEDWYIDIMCANLLNPELQSKFQVLLLPNLYGDIITDEAAQIQGGVGTAGSANIGDRYALFEAIHGSAPRMIEKGIGEYANPSSIIRAFELLLRHIGLQDKADILNAAMQKAEKEKSVVVTGDQNGATCHDFGDYVLSFI